MENILEQLQPVMLDAISVVLMVAIAYVINLFRKKTGLEIEARHREALHSVIMTGVQSAVRDGPQETKAEIIEKAIEYARVSVPQAVKKFGGDNFLLNRIATRYTNELLNKIESKLE